jgi:hypothetical protein
VGGEAPGERLAAGAQRAGQRVGDQPRDAAHYGRGHVV